MLLSLYLSAIPNLIADGIIQSTSLFVLKKVMKSHKFLYCFCCRNPNISLKGGTNPFSSEKHGNLNHSWLVWAFMGTAVNRTCPPPLLLMPLLPLPPLFCTPVHQMFTILFIPLQCLLFFLLLSWHGAIEHWVSCCNWIHLSTGKPSIVHAYTTCL